VDSRDLLKRDRAFYEQFLVGLRKGPNVELVHYIERSYAVLFGPMTYTKLQDYSQANV
jgi:hypothetical protein